MATLTKMQVSGLDSTPESRETAPVSQRDPKRLGDALRRRRGELGVTQEEFAQRSELSLKTVQRVEIGRTLAHARTLAKIDAGAGWPAGHARDVQDGLVEAGAPPGSESVDYHDLEPLSPEWWLALRRVLPAELFAQVAEQIYRTQLADTQAVDGDDTSTTEDAG